jgi:hypothetical protein
MLASGDPMPENLRTVRDSSGNLWTRHGNEWARASWGSAVSWKSLLSMAGPVEPVTTDEDPKRS